MEHFCQPALKTLTPSTLNPPLLMNPTSLETSLKPLRLSGLCQSLGVRLQEAAANRLSHAEFLELIVHALGPGAGLRSHQARLPGDVSLDLRLGARFFERRGLQPGRSHAAQISQTRVGDH